MQNMDIQPIFSTSRRPILIAGPCSAETEEQVLATARALALQHIDLFRAGIWKPRTRPDSFEGVGEAGLSWLRRVKEETGLKVTTEVANAEHVEKALAHQIDVLWVGARTSANPFSVQEIADALTGVDIPVMVKNPINPDLKLWLGAVERLYKSGIRRMAIIHRGFSYYGETQYRNTPRWQIPIEMKRLLPDIQLICDNSHICGRRDILPDTAQKAMDLNFDGLMTEVHPAPDSAWSDASQQITPDSYLEMIANLVLRKPSSDDPEFLAMIEQLRYQIDEIDEDMIQLLARRMQLAEQIGGFKREKQIAILQSQRWNQVLEKGLRFGRQYGLSEAFMKALLKTIHQESINHQAFVMNERLAPEASNGDSERIFFEEESED
ncbi:MAG: bifunctional 3-deoxy-7-phosphoheptulonate synthase/chorismate mutase type II [Saprospirales bacterium]|nr:bifunctional 3-deoxy-7-phosphoheptulonate synthase/chorismate mutase type II [Saprospirales bacterium]